MIRISRSIVPNSFTVGNMLSGYMSIVFSVNQKDFTLAAWMIVLAAFLDAIDGKVARITNSSSKFGVEYDSLADVVSFGVAPSVLIYQYYFIHLSHIGLFFSFFPVLFGSIRLARFNVELTGFTKTHFSGLPIPAAAITLASYILLSEKYFSSEPVPRLIMVITAVVSLLMVSNVRYEVFPQVTFRGSKKQKIIFSGLIVVGVLLLLFPNLLIFPFMILYILSGLIFSAFQKTTEHRRRRKSKNVENNDEDDETDIE
ncbi:MAG: CDP-diacylglycerol--serine O-phosphatidyltransferase [Calditrichae bacterium]|nr:CDP-diacylglycerol--serine O-phosphatidyltransferase [Calditrichota bacterium]MCB9059089.1 CDP-diacylglycerol--serine O-phosphatidyltransferase [Calditrichia bacterium]